MDKYVIAPPSGSNNNSVGAQDRPWEEGHFDSVKLNGGDLGEYLAESTGYGIVSGCEPSISGLTVTVGAGIVHLADGTRKEIASTNITLDSADPTNPRIDLVYIDSTGAVAKITGTAAASPSAPTLPSGGISVCNVSVAAGATTGTVTDKRGMLLRFYNTGIVNVKDFGAVGDGVTDDKDAIRALTDYLYSNNGGYVIFPKGNYVSSKALVIPPNTIIDFNGSLFYLSQYSRSGEAIMICGDNVIVKNVKVNYYGSSVPFKPSDANHGCLGVSTSTYQSEIDFIDENSNEREFENRKNILVENFYTDGSYATQVEDASEDASNATIENVVFRNIVAPNGFISVLPHNANVLNKILYENVECDGVRLGLESKPFDVTLKNVRAHIGRSSSPGLVVDNAQIITDTTSRHYQVFGHIFEVNARTNINNMVIDGAGEFANGLNIGPTSYDASLEYGNISLNNVRIINCTATSAKTPNAVFSYVTIRASNCYFEQHLGVNTIMSNSYAPSYKNAQIAYNSNENIAFTVSTGWENYTSAVARNFRRCGNRVLMNFWLSKNTTAREGETLITLDKYAPSIERNLIGYVSTNSGDYKPILLAVTTAGKIIIKKKCQSSDLSTAPIILFIGDYEI